MRSAYLKAGISSLMIRATLLGLEFLVAILLARALGADGYGVYAYYFALVKLITIPTSAGLPTLTIRQVAYYNATHEWGLLRGFLVRMNQIVLLLSLVVILTVILLFDGHPMLYWSMAMVPLLALGNLRGAALRAVQRLIQGQIPENIVRPGLFLALVAGVLLAGPSEWLTPTSAMAFHVTAAACAFMVGAFLLMRNLPRPAFEAERVHRDSEWLWAAIPFTMIAGITIVTSQASIIIVGLMMEPEHVGLLRIAEQVTLAVVFPLAALNMVLAPRIAHLHKTGDKEGLQYLIRWGTLMSFSISVVLAAFAIAAGPTLLPLLFGGEFSASYWPMVALVLGQVGKSLTAAVAPLLKMVGLEKTFAWAAFLAAMAHVALTILLVPTYGIMGAAVSAAVTMVALYCWLAYISISRLGINPYPFGRSQKRA